jgi:adenylate cyclase
VPRKRAERRLAAILAADVVGYSRLMRADEAGTLARVNALREDVIGPKVKKHRGRIVKLMGDGALVEFASVVNAVECAVEIQRVLADRNEELPEGRRVEFRIGINAGDILVEGDDIHGDAVNVAARMEGLAEAGGICVSAKVFDEVRRQADLGFADLGEQRVKSIPDPIRAYRVLLDPAFARTVVSADPGVPSIAVLPFENLSRDYWLGYFSDGIAEDIIAVLAKHPDLPVIARESSFAYRGREADDPEVARALDVRYMLDGGVRRTDRRIEITARLVDSKTGDPIWTERYNRPLGDVFTILNDIRHEVLTALNIAPPEDGKERTTANPEAYDLLLRARELRYNFQPATTEEAIRFIERAVELDPGFATGWSELAITHHLAATSGWAASSDGAWDRAIECAGRALALDPSLGEGHTVLGAILLKRGEFSRAIRELEAGTAANPSAAWPVAMLAHALPHHGRPTEGLEMIQRAFRLNPSAPGWYFAAKGWSHFALRQHYDAITAFGEAVARSPYDFESRIGLTVAHQAAGREDDARAQAREVLGIDPEFSCSGARNHVVDPVLRERQIVLLRQAGLPDGTSETDATAKTGAMDGDAWLTAYIDTVNANMPPNLNADAIANCYAEDCVHIQPLRELPGGPFRGREAQRRFFASFDAHWAEWTHIEVSRMTHGNLAVWEGLAQGIHKKTGKFVRMPIVFFFEFDEIGKIKEERTYLDNGLVEEQIR